MIVKRKPKRNVIKDALEWKVKHRKSFCPWMKHKKDLNSRNMHHTCQAKLIDWRHIEQYHPRNSLARVPSLLHMFEGWLSQETRQRENNQKDEHSPSRISKQARDHKKFKCLHPTRSFLLLLHLSVHLEFTKTNYWKHLHHHKTQAQIWYQSPYLDGAKSDHKQSSKKPKFASQVLKSYSSLVHTFVK